jgi:hypothetical protein
MRMKIGSRSLAGLVGMTLVLGVSAVAQEGAAAGDEQVRKQALQHWEDFIHYLRIAQLQLARSAGQALLETPVSDEDLLAVVDELAPYRDYDRTLITAQKMEDEQIVELAAAVQKRVEEARLNLARDPARVRRNIELLDDGLRARINATERLKRAGEYAAPGLLNVLLSGEDEDRVLQPYVQQAMVEVGRPLVGPLTEAFEHLPPIPKQQVAEVLARIGYPAALPFLKAELTRPIDRETRQVIETAFDRIIERSGVPRTADAATLFLMLGEDYYSRRETLVLEPQAPFNLLWTYTPGVGLTYREISTAYFHDVMAMRAARRSLGINRQYAAALSLWLAANFRRENNLGDTEDPSYAPHLNSPHYYATLAGPTHVQPVLSRAIQDGDAELALDAIRALAATATTAERIGQDVQPVIAAMVYPDRRVRFEAAMALAQSLPRVDFAGAGRVVPVLAEAIREVARPYALVISPDQEAINAARDFLGDEYQMIFGYTYDEAAQQAATVPAVDLVVIRMRPVQMEQAVAAARNDVKLMGAPILVLSGADDVPAVTQMFSRRRGVVVTSEAASTEELATAARQATGSNQGPGISPEQALAYSTRALSLLLDLTKEAGQTFRADDALPALIAALGDSRDPVVLGSAAVLARLEAPAAQRAVADAALDAQREEPMRIALLRTLADSARLYGNLLGDSQLQLLLRLVRESQGELADAAAEAHGALDLPTSNAVEFILQ